MGWVADHRGPGQEEAQTMATRRDTGRQASACLMGNTAHDGPED
jgi:hypothetical protein